MDFETGKKAIDFLIRHSANRKFLELDFFGGEPLMNFDVVKQIVKYARSREEECSKKFRFTITTNVFMTGIMIRQLLISYACMMRS